MIKPAIELEVAKAYCDMHNEGDFKFSDRNLNFRSSEYLPLNEVMVLMDFYCPQYNSFNYLNLNALQTLGNPMIQIAREGSVCMYVKGIDKNDLSENVIIDYIYVNLGADECDWVGDEYRIWWD